MTTVPKPPTILKVIEGATVLSPEPLGRMDVLVAGGVIAGLRREPFALGGIDHEVIDGRDKVLVPGFIDGHVHILGGGGEGGYATRTPEILLSDLTAAGVTTSTLSRQNGWGWGGPATDHRQPDTSPRPRLPIHGGVARPWL